MKKVFLVVFLLGLLQLAIFAGNEPKEIACKVFAACDNSYELALNGKVVMSGKDWTKADSKLLKLRLGDILTVKCCDSGAAAGFALIGKVKNKPWIVTDKGSWRTYTPADINKWWEVPGETTPCQEASAPVGEVVSKKAGSNCAVIWGAGNPSYLLRTISEEDIK